jgi:hypothetical protein
MDIHKYLKYKEKYLHLKKISLQLGGAIYYHDRKKAKDTESTALRIRPNNLEEYVKDVRGNNIVLGKFEDVKLNGKEQNPTTGIIYGLVEKNGLTGWVNMEYIHEKLGESIDVRCLKSIPLRMRPDNLDNYIEDESGNIIILQKNEDVKLKGTERNPTTDILYGLVEKNGLSGWVNIEHIHKKLEESVIVRCLKSIPLRMRSDNLDNYIEDESGNIIILQKNEDVKLKGTERNPTTGILYGLVKKNGLNGWVNMEHLQKK